MSLIYDGFTHDSVPKSRVHTADPRGHGVADPLD